jgi:hypothetical protein
MKTKVIHQIRRFSWGLFLAVLLIGAGYMGRARLEVGNVQMTSQAEERDSFCQLDWIIEDFQTEFLGAYSDLVRQFITEKSDWNDFKGEYHAWMKAGDRPDTPGAWDTFQREHQPAPDYDPFTWVTRFQETLAKLERSSPSPFLMVHLLRLHEHLGQREEYERLLAVFERHYPEHPIVAAARARESSNGESALDWSPDSGVSVGKSLGMNLNEGAAEIRRINR